MTHQTHDSPRLYPYRTNKEVAEAVTAAPTLAGTMVLGRTRIVL